MNDGVGNSGTHPFFELFQSVPTDQIGIDQNQQIDHVPSTSTNDNGIIGQNGETNELRKSDDEKMEEVDVTTNLEDDYAEQIQHEQIQELKACGLSQEQAVIAVCRSEDEYQNVLQFISPRKD